MDNRDSRRRDRVRTSSFTFFESQVSMSRVRMVSADKGSNSGR